MNKQDTQTSENQADSATITQTNTDSPVDRIEQSAMLSPISPHPVHVAETVSIPVLNNQMDYALDTPEVHVSAPETSNTSSVELDYDPETAAAATTTFVQQPKLQQATSSASTSEATNDSSASSSSSPPSVIKAPAPTEIVQNNRSVPTDVDLQALLTSLSPTVPQHPVSLQGTQTPPAAPTAQTPPSQTRSASLPQPPAVVQVAQSQVHAQPTHPLPAPPATFAGSSNTGAVHTSHPAGYPASLPLPPNFNQHRQSAIPSSPTETDDNEEESRPFTADEEDEYERFLTDERDYVTQGQWDRFPAGSRLFIGNLPTEKVTKRDLFRIFHRHGRLAQVSIKQAYGFVQFLDISSCAAALRHEQGSTVRGRKMHLEVSKPQRNTRPAPSAESQRGSRRSRSPDYGRPVSPRGRGNFRGGRGDFNDRSFRRDTRDRDYEYNRRPSPPRHRVRDDWRPNLRSRSRSPPPRYRGRSRSPLGDTLPPRREPKDVPDVQAIVTDELDRNFIWWVEKAFRVRNLTYDLLYLHPRMPLDPVIKQQILEGVQAIVFLDSQKQRDSNISLQVFNRHGSAEADFDRYDNIEPEVGAELVIRAKQAIAQPQVSTMPYAYMSQQPYAQLGNLLGSMDPGTLNRLLTSLQVQTQQQGLQQNPMGQQRHQPPQQLPSMAPDLAALLAQASSNLGQVTAGQQYSAPPQLGVNTGYGSNAQVGLAALMAGQTHSPVRASHPPAAHHQASQQQPPPGQMQNIMETLAKWKQG
ncbi:hypothetical protein L873DRAFT_1685803 [Choiromyces venosus 120613-1]|uniref:RRM domain-containing protein n=1 Tax=Choiromyces venosus 120613-1 TaxID=1336337 RepID=A0A3N4JL33_9PEZI|nr:hypothetical protein L873DRAFT_1685803 [Choiromyces venosus 120613-1]